LDNAFVIAYPKIVHPAADRTCTVKTSETTLWKYEAGDFAADSFGNEIIIAEVGNVVCRDHCILHHVVELCVVGEDTVLAVFVVLNSCFLWEIVKGPLLSE
jgi:hypothetical protein